MCTCSPVKKINIAVNEWAKLPVQTLVFADAIKEHINWNKDGVLLSVCVELFLMYSSIVISRNGTKKYLQEVVDYIKTNAAIVFES